MPSTTERMRKFMGADLQRKREGKETKTGMSERQLRDYAKKPLKKRKKKMSLKDAEREYARG